MNDKKYLQVIEWACQFREEAEATGRGTRFPTVQECAKRFRVAQKSILEAIDSGDHPKGYHCAYNVAIASGGGVGEWKQSEYEIEVWRNNPADLRFDQATYKDIKRFWGKRGFEPFGPGAKETLKCWFRIYKPLKNRCGLGIDFQSGQLIYTYWELDEIFGPPLSQSTTFGEALEILNELAATRAFGGWAVEEGRAEGS